MLYPSRAIIYRETTNQIINVAPIIDTTDLVSGQEGLNEVSDDEADVDEEATPEL